MVDLIYSEESYQIIGACFEVHRNLGPGFLEAVYTEALMWEFEERDIPYEKNRELSIEYKGKLLSKKYYADFVCYDKIIIELKAIDTLTQENISQVLNYLKATKMRLGILANFGEQKFHSRRIIL
ncbi:MAG: GxxExxY protein [Bacteroidales bacterium]|nr:GxxExxY protein [Bacteroidales bacterium]